MSKQKKKHGWVLRDPESESYVDKDYEAGGVALRNARVYLTRIEARNSKLNRDHIYKVLLTLKGRAKKVIKGR
ncbi:hypothetical protein LCGC14_2811670 [marine sediment metagenome]|uniref:Uncharacterized protein n=1 Tax=marine sediment metagenome TaxID=412755 RepID=A0A0F9BB12_9ZZZZ